jgi:hypothetical protein
MSYGLKAASNKMAMARGAKFMKVHNLPGWYNTNGNLFGNTPRLSKEDRAMRYKLKMMNAKLAIAGMKQNVAARKLYGSLVVQKLKAKAPWSVARQSGVRLFNKMNMKDILKGAIGSNSKGMGWAKYKNDFYPLIGTSKSYGYVINLSKKNQPARYNSVIKGLKPYRAPPPNRIPRLKF